MSNDLHCLVEQHLVSIKMVAAGNESISRKLTIKMNRFMVVFFVVACTVAVSSAPVKEETTTKSKEHPTSTTMTTEKGHSMTEKTNHMCGDAKKPHDELTHKEAIRRLRETTHDKHPGTTTSITTQKAYTPPAHKANVDLLKKDNERVKCPVHDSRNDGKKEESHIYNLSEVSKSGKH